MSVTVKNFGMTKDGKAVKLYSIKNKNGVIAEITDFGAILVNLLVPDASGKPADIVLGYDSVEGYYENDCFFGATIGPSANRIANAAFMIDDVKYQLAVNDGNNNLHSDSQKGYHKCLWNAIPADDSVIFTLEDTDNNMGFPGNKKIKVTYTLTSANEVKIEYCVDSDKKTLINMTNHTYFNLAGHDSGDILKHNMQIMASHYTPVVAGSIPTGEIASVAGTPFDFLKATKVGEHIDDDNEQLRLGQGYDHNWVIDNYNGKLQKIAEVSEEITGRSMQVLSDLPGVQFYAGNCITPQSGKKGASYGKRSGLCLETQAFPNSVNEPEFPDVIYGPDRTYKATTIYRFSW